MNYLMKSSLLLELLVNIFAESSAVEREVDFSLRVREWPSKLDELFRLDYKDAVLESSFDASKATTFLIHGFLEDATTPHQQQLSSALLDAEDQNVFFVDWGSTRKSFWYPEAVDRVPEVAKIVADFINFMTDRASLELERTTIIGFSLGAHIAGLAAKNLKNGKVGKIIGVDPAGPSFSIDRPLGRLDRNDAEYVECIHTGFIFGIREPICQVDFYVNGGKDQPGCERLFGTYDIICSHSRAVEVLIEALYNEKAFHGRRCESLDDALDMNCYGSPGAFLNDKDNELNKLSGIFHISTFGQPPYGKGLTEEF